MTNHYALPLAPFYQVSRLSDQTIAINIHDTELDVHLCRTATACLSRVLANIRQDQDFLIVTSSTPDCSASQNMTRFGQLRTDLGNLLSTGKIGGYWLIAHWRVSDPATNSVEVSPSCEPVNCQMIDALEHSWLLIKPFGISTALWKSSASAIASLYDQDIFLIRQAGLTQLCEKNGDVWDTVCTDDSVEEVWESLAWSRANRLLVGTVELGKLCTQEKSFPFDCASTSHTGFCQNSYYLRPTNSEPANAETARIQMFVAEPHNNSSKAYFSYATIYRADKIPRLCCETCVTGMDRCTYRPPVIHYVSSSVEGI
jgi:hypothetical protein